MGSTLEDLRAMPEAVRRGVGYALDRAQRGSMHPSAKPMKGPELKGAVEVVEDYRGDTYRAAYIARLASAVYVLHVFQKKSTRGAVTPARHPTTIRQRLRAARQLDQRGTDETR